MYRVSTEDTKAHLNGRIGSVVGRMVAGWIVLFGAALMFGHYLPVTPLALLVGCLTGLSASRAAMATWLRANAYRSGWIEGRQALIQAMADGARADRPAHQVLRDQLDHDLGLFR